MKKYKDMSIHEKVNFRSRSKMLINKVGSRMEVCETVKTATDKEPYCLEKAYCKPTYQIIEG